MTVYQKMITAAAAALTLGLAACGGGGGSPLQPTTPSPTPKPTVCQTDAMSQACVDERKDAKDAAKKALDAVRADRNSTQAQITDAQTAYDAAKKAYDEAITNRAKYVAALPPEYGLDAMAKAVGQPGTLPASLNLANDDATDDAIDGGVVTVPVSDADNTNTWSKAAWPAEKIAGFAVSVWKKSADGDSVVVYTNKQAAKGAKWSVYYAETEPSPGEAADGFAWVVRNNAVFDVDDAGVIDIEENLANDGHELIDAAMFPTGKGVGITYPDNDTNPDNTFEVAFAGTFHGVTGRFKCTNDNVACAAGNNDDGELASLTGAWTFTPDSTDATVAGVQTDVDYLDFGHWVRTVDAAAGPSYTVNGFFRGEDPYESNIGTLTGAATYKGGAAGLYARRAFAAVGEGAVTAAGRFTADATLTAKFGGDDVAPSDRFSVTGTIDNFMDGGKAIDAAWRVELAKAAINQNTGAIAVTGGGSWSGQLYGDDAPDDNGVYPLPTGVAGRFTAKFDNGGVIGAFGAAKTGE